MDKQKIISDIRQLTVEEQIDLVEEVWDNIAAQSDRVPLADEQKRLLDESLAELERNPDAGRPWEEVLDRIRRKK